MANAKAKVVQIKGVTFAAKTSSNHWLTIDGPEQFGGSDAATRPKELLLVSLAGCTGSDVASILAKMREKVTRFEVHAEAEQTDQHPKVYKSIHLTFKVWGEDIKEANVEKAIKLSSEVYCGVTAMLKNSVKITESYEINPQE